jgi:hypothetical protein
VKAYRGFESLLFRQYHSSENRWSNLAQGFRKPGDGLGFDHDDRVLPSRSVLKIRNVKEAHAKGREPFFIKLVPGKFRGAA